MNPVVQQGLTAINAEEAHRVREKYKHVPPILTATASRFDTTRLRNCKIQLYPHQLAMVQRMFDADEYILKGRFVSEMFLKGECGCGKTYALIAFMAALKQQAGTQRKVAATLVVVPGTLVTQWRLAIREFGSGLVCKVLETYSEIMNLHTSASTFLRNDIVLTSIDSYPTLRDTLTGLNLSVERVIVDEVDGVAECQRIDCATFATRRLETGQSLQTIHSMTTGDQAINNNTANTVSGGQRGGQMTVVKPIPARYVIRVSATMTIPESTRTNHVVTVVECDKAFIQASIKLEVPFVNTVRCKDMYIQSILRHVLNENQLNALHALDFKTALRGFSGRGSIQVEDAHDVMEVVLNTYSSELQFNNNIIIELIRGFPALEDLDPLYGKEFQTLLVTDPAVAGGEPQVRLAPSMSPQLREWMSELTNNVPIHICEKYDEIKAECKRLRIANLRMRKRMSDADLCPGGYCHRTVSSQTRLYATPCCELQLCLFCFEKQQIDQQQLSRNPDTEEDPLADPHQGERCMLCREPASIRDYRLLHVQAADATENAENSNEASDEEQLLEDKKTALLNIIVGRKAELQEARTKYFENPDNSLPAPPVPKFLVGSGFSEIFMTLEPALKEVGITMGHLESGTAKKTDAVVRKFCDTEEIDVLFCQLSSVGSSVGRGLNLQVGSDVIFFERPSPAMAEQLIGRLQRPGRVSQLQVWNILHENE